MIGSVDTSEFLVAAAASIGFLIGIGGEGVRTGYVIALLAGGVVAAPLAAYLVRVLPPQMLGSLVGGVIVLTNARTLVQEAGITGAGAAAIYLGIVAGWAAAVAWSARTVLRDRAAERDRHRRGAGGRARPGLGDERLGRRAEGAAEGGREGPPRWCSRPDGRPGPAPGRRRAARGRRRGGPGSARP